MKKLALYLHWPFCKSKCPYCDFNSHVADTIDVQAFENAYKQELRSLLDTYHYGYIDTIFIGGGTPSLMPTNLIDSLINWLDTHYQLATDIEITLEANPTSVELRKFKDFKSTGINRLSLGIQSLRDSDLVFLGREHSSAQAIEAIQLTKEIFDRYSFDLIYARPNQTLKDWEEELHQALLLCDGHLSAYQLTIEKGTPFYRQFHDGKFTLPDENSCADLYDLTNDILASHQLTMYEISNYAKHDHQCRHNLHYWRYHDYLGVGPGAHSRITDDLGNKHSIMTVHKPEKWLDLVNKNGHGIQTHDTLSDYDIACEKLMMGLRLVEGLNIQSFPKSFINYIESLPEDQSYLEYDNSALKITDQGRLLTNSIIHRLIEQLPTQG